MQVEKLYALAEVRWHQSHRLVIVNIEVNEDDEDDEDDEEDGEDGEGGGNVDRFAVVNLIALKSSM